MKSENHRLEEIAKNSLYTTFCNTMTIEYSFEIFNRFIKKGNILELGPAEGLMTNHLYKITDNLTLVDGSQKFCEDLITKFPKATVINQLFEEFEPECMYDNIILGHVLEHVIDPLEILKKAKQWLSPEGIVLSAVPNSRSIHRQTAVAMGLLSSEDSRSELDIHHGHRRIYNPESFRNAFYQSGLNIIHFGGYWLKPISNSQIHESWTKEMLHASMIIGERYPDIAAEIYIVANNQN